MKIFHRKKTEQEFKKFVEESDEFTDFETKRIQNIFKHKQIRIIFTMTMYLLLWSFCAAFVDTFLVTRGIWYTAAGESMLLNFLPTFLFLLVNASLKFTFIYFYLRNRVYIKTWQILVGVIPLIGSLFVTAILLRKRKLFFTALKKYIHHRKKKRLEFITNINTSSK